jgi:hypothetical protein
VTAAWYIGGVLVWLAVIGLAELAGRLAPVAPLAPLAELAQLAELPEVWTDTELDSLAELGGHRFQRVSWTGNCGWLSHPRADRCGRPRNHHPRRPSV